MDALDILSEVVPALAASIGNGTTKMASELPFKPGYKFSIMPPSLDHSLHRYATCFTVTSDFKAQYTSGIKPRPETQKRADDYVFNRAMSEGLL